MIRSTFFSSNLVCLTCLIVGLFLVGCKRCSTCELAIYNGTCSCEVVESLSLPLTTPGLTKEESQTQELLCELAGICEYSVQIDRYYVDACGRAGVFGNRDEQIEELESAGFDCVAD